VSPAAAAGRLATSLTNSPVQIETFSGVGHGVFRQAPQAAFDLLRSFLRQVAPPD
jgi:pimeloyl-ACP methyl ester carboxylesterase